MKGPGSLSEFQDLVWGRFWLTYGTPVPYCSPELVPVSHIYRGHSACLSKIVMLSCNKRPFGFLVPSCITYPSQRNEIHRELGIETITICYYLEHPLIHVLIAPLLFTPGEETTAVPSLVGSVSGVVLELGPASGSQIPRYNTAKLTKVYGVEPCRSLHAGLRATTKKHDLGEIYEIVPCGMEDAAELTRRGITEGTIDTVLSIQVLCSVKDPKETAKLLYRLLKPGGSIVLYEHVRSDRELGRLFQSQWTTSPKGVSRCRKSCKESLHRNRAQSTELTSHT